MENDPRFKKLLVEDRNKAMDFVKFSVQNDRNAAHVRQLVVGSIGFVAGFLVAILAS
jgi:hypothetical protein